MWGTIAFVASQAVRLPVLLGLTALSRMLGWDFGADGNFWFNAVVLSLSAALFEEIMRYLVLRFLAKDVRGWSEAVMFGAGYGGIEAILIVGLGAISNAFLLINAEALLVQTRAVATAQADALAAQVAALQGVNIGLIGASLIERVFAIMLQTSFSVMAMMAVERRQLKWVLLAMLLHACVNLAAVVAQRFSGVVVAELLASVFGLVLLAFTLRQRPPSPQPRTL